MRRAVVLLAVVAALAACSSDKKDATPPTTTVAPTSTTVASTTSTSSSRATTTTTSLASTTSTAPSSGASTIVRFSGPTAAVQCNAPTSVELSWETRGASSVKIVLDKTSPYSYSDGAHQELLYLPCDGKSHTYELQAKSAQGTATKSITVQTTKAA